MAYTTLTITGTLVGGQPAVPIANATVTMLLSHQITDGTTNIIPTTYTATTNNAGQFSISNVVANDDGTTTPVGTSYAVQVTASSGAPLDQFSVIVPHASAPTVDLFSLARLGSAPSASVPYVISVNGESGIVTADPAGAAAAAQAAAEAASIPLPSSPSTGEVVTWSGSAWIAAAAAGGGVLFAQAVSTSNGSSLSGTTTIDGQSLNAGDVVLLVNQTTASQNGPWTIAAGSWTRPSTFAHGSTQTPQLVYVVNGTVFNSTVWGLQCATAGITVDTSSQTWAFVDGSLAGTVTATGTGATLPPGKYRFTCVGGGAGGGGGGHPSVNTPQTGGSGGQGGQIVTGEILSGSYAAPSFTIGSGGTGGYDNEYSSGSGGPGVVGGDTHVTLASVTVTTNQNANANGTGGNGSQQNQTNTPSNNIWSGTTTSTGLTSPGIGGEGYQGYGQVGGPGTSAIAAGGSGGNVSTSTLGGSGGNAGGLYVPGAQVSTNTANANGGNGANAAANTGGGGGGGGSAAYNSGSAGTGGTGGTGGSGVIYWERV